MASLTTYTKAKVNDKFIEPLLSHDGIISALAEFDDLAAKWVSKGKANGLFDEMASNGGQVCPPLFYSGRGDFLFFLLGFKPSCLILHGSEAQELFCTSLLEEVLRPVLRSLEELGAVSFRWIDWACNPSGTDTPAGSFKDTLVVINTGHPCASTVLEAFFPGEAVREQANNSTQPNEVLYLKVGLALDYPTYGHPRMVDVEYAFGDGPDDVAVEYVTNFNGSNITRFLKHFCQYRDACKPFGWDLRFCMGGEIVSNQIVDLLIRMEPGIGKPQRYAMDRVVDSINSFGDEPRAMHAAVIAGIWDTLVPQFDEVVLQRGGKWGIEDVPCSYQCPDGSILKARPI